MSVITFYSIDNKETGQTVSLAAITTYMAIKHNYKMLSISTGFRDASLENCFWKGDFSKGENKGITNLDLIGIGSGIEGLGKALVSNRTQNNVVTDYAKVVFKDRLEVLNSPQTKYYSEYKKICDSYPLCIEVSRKNYDLVFVDLSKRVPENLRKQILEMSDVIVINLNQGLKAIEEFMELKEREDFYKQNKIMISIGKYDRFSKYNEKNLTRLLKEKNLISVIPYNTLFFESCTEGKLPDFFLKLRNVDESDRNYFFIREVDNMCNNIIYKLKELNLKA